LPDSACRDYSGLPLANVPAAAGPPVRKKRTARRQKAGSFRLMAAILTGLLLISVGYLVFSQARLTRLREDRVNAYAAMVRKYDKGTDSQKAWIREYARANNVHPAFIAAVLYCESTYDPRAVSGVGARGLMQIMEGTASWIAGKLGDRDYSFDNMFDPETNIRYGAWYIAYLNGIFGGDPIKIACAYHAGKDNVKMWMMNYTVDGFTLTLDDIPMSDTQDYARKVLNAYTIYLQNFYQDGA
jgi:soluble lytic murein transglycosylase